MKKILVTTDFSLPAQYATEVAMDLGRKTNAGIILLHIAEHAADSSFNIEGEVAYAQNWEDKLFTMKMIERAKEQLASAADDLVRAGVTVKTELRLGNPFHGIRTIINEHDVDLVVMGASGQSKLEEMIIGSNTEKVVRHAKCPVLTVHEKPVHETFQDIVYATSLNHDEHNFSDILRHIQSLYNATLHIVRINTPDNFQPDTAVKKVMQTFAEKLNLSHYTLNIFNDYSEEEGILHFTESVNADLIAMATHGRKGFAHILAGSIAESVANHSKRPVLTFATKRETQ